MASLSARLQEFSCLALRLTGVPWLVREIYARRKVTITNYHDPKPDIFDRHMAVFSRAYSFIGIDQLTRALELKDFSDLPDKPLLVTLDDAHAGNAELFQTLRKYGIPAVIYAVAGVVNTTRGFWFDRLNHGGETMERLKNLPDVERRTILERDFAHTDEREYEVASALSAEQLRDFIALGGAVGSHTVFHPLLDRCDELTGRKECEGSREMLEKMLGTSVRHFALPNGNAHPQTRAWIKKAGYLTCRTTEPGWITDETDPLALPNFGLGDDAGVNKAMIQACGLWDLAKKMAQRLNSGK